MTHNLKTLSQYFHRVESGEKPFEVRKNDRDFQTGDLVYLEDFDGTNFSGKKILGKITYILQGGQFGIERGHCVFGFEVIEKI
jgi:hypothetical protein